MTAIEGSDGPEREGAPHEQQRAAGRAGGDARAQSLNPERLSDIGRAGANARWNATRATHAGTLVIGPMELPCFVLEDGSRVLSNSGIVEALGMSQGGYRRQNTSRPSSDRLARFVGSRGLKAHVSDTLCLAVSEPVRFRYPNRNQLGWGYPATVLAEICEAVLAAREDEDLDPQQQHIADRAQLLVRAFARIGIIALVDEATGYQDERARDELHAILAAYIAPQLLPWAKRFPDEFYREMFRLRKWQFRPGFGAKPMMAGKLTCHVVYERLPPGVLDELRARNPVRDNGRRKHSHHQYLTEEVGHPHLEKHLASVTTLMRISKTWRQFDGFLNEAFPKVGDQMRLRVDPEDLDVE